MITPTTTEIAYSVINAMAVSSIGTSLDAQNDGLRIKHQTVSAYLELSKTYRAFANPTIFINSACGLPKKIMILQRWFELNFSQGFSRNSLREIKDTILMIIVL